MGTPILRAMLKASLFFRQLHACQGVSASGWMDAGLVQRNQEEGRTLEGLVRRPCGTQRTGLAPGEGRPAPLGCHHKQVGWAEAWDLVLRWETCPRWYPEKKEATSLRPRRWWKPAVLRLLAGGVLAPNLGTHYWASRACCTGNNGVIDPTT